MNSKYAGFNGMPLSVAEMYADNKRNWKPGDTLYTANNQNIRDAYGITQDVPLAQVEDYISALKREGTKNQLLTKISATELPTSVTSAAEKIQNFNYNPDNDAAYKSYVDAYNRQGQSAAKQTLNNLNAANMGRNSSYSAAATAQVQAAYAKQAADMIPQLAQQAYDRLVNNYSIAKDIEDTKYNRAITGYNALADYETRQLTDRQLDLNNQAAELELAYLPTTLRQQVESGEITLEQARLQLALDYKYGEGDRQLAQDQARATISKAYKSGSSSVVKQQSMKDADKWISNYLYSPYNSEGTGFWKYLNEDSNTAYSAVDKLNDADEYNNIIDTLIASGYSYDAAVKKAEQYKTDITIEVMKREGKDWNDDDLVNNRRNQLFG